MTDWTRRTVLALLPATGLAPSLAAQPVGDQRRAGLAEARPMIETLSDYMASAGAMSLPTAVSEKTKSHIMDTFAAMVSGRDLEPGKLAISFVRREGGVADATVIGSNIVTSATNAAFANGMMAHADETDDSHQAAFFHPGAAIVPAALAVGEREGRSGADFLKAVALGYDIGARFGMTLGANAFHLSGRSSHSFAGLFGAAAAAGSMYRLNAQQMRFLLSYTAQQASGISTWQRDTDHIEKAFDFGGMPARNGVAGASMVAHGMTAVDDVLSGAPNFLGAFGVEANAPRLTEGLGSTFQIMKADIKKWSVGSPIQAALDSTLELIKTHRVTANQVTNVRVEIQDTERAIVDNRDLPSISLQHLVAVMLVDGTITFAATHDKARMNDPEVRALRAKVELVGSPELTRGGGRQAIVTITLNDGRTVRHHTSAVRGTWRNPLTSAELVEKCAGLMSGVLGAPRARQLIEILEHVDRLDDVRKLRGLLRG